MGIHPNTWQKGAAMITIPDGPLTRVVRVEYMRRILRCQRMTREELMTLFRISENTLYRDLLLLRSEPFYENVTNARVWYVEPIDCN
jgi:hypothetical protein